MESLYEAYERFKDLLRKCPRHGLSDQQKILDGAARGSLINQYPEDAFEILEDITSNNYRVYDRARKWQDPQVQAPTPKKPVYPPPPYPQCLQKQKQDKQFQKFMDFFKKLSINILFAKALEQMSSYVKEEITPKLKDPGSFTIPCTIGTQNFGRALCDLGASVNLMPLSISMKLGVGEVKPTLVRLQLADMSYAYPRGRIEDVHVKINKFIFPTDFIVLDIEEDEEIPLLFGRPFLAT
ncbi:uncharacterized protein LOC141715049 [Apium graveolens]|uniref:uncharacterized protein LOC141715049 n=1 Tax=Apium graveolens TaxID=4045 RepID=UPI003D7A0278